nr:MAG TPA: hypothetical protein [Caudoviricetes sp.]
MMFCFKLIEKIDCAMRFDCHRFRICMTTC